MGRQGRPRSSLLLRVILKLLEGKYTVPELTEQLNKKDNEIRLQIDRIEDEFKGIFTIQRDKKKHKRVIDKLTNQYTVIIKDKKKALEKFIEEASGTKSFVTENVSWLKAFITTIKFNNVLFAISEYKYEDEKTAIKFFENTLRDPLFENCLDSIRKEETINGRNTSWFTLHLLSKILRKHTSEKSIQIIRKFLEQKLPFKNSFHEELLWLNPLLASNAYSPLAWSETYPPKGVIKEFCEESPLPEIYIFDQIFIAGNSQKEKASSIMKKFLKSNAKNKHYFSRMIELFDRIPNEKFVAKLNGEAWEIFNWNKKQIGAAIYAYTIKGFYYYDFIEKIEFSL